VRQGGRAARSRPRGAPARSGLRAGRLPIAEARAWRFGDATGKTLSGQRATPHGA